MPDVTKNLNLHPCSFNPFNAQFSPCNFSDEVLNRYYVVHEPTRRRFTKEFPLIDRVKFLILATIGPVAQIIMTLLAELFYSLRLISCIDLWTSADQKTYSERFATMAFLAAEITLILPLATIALEATAIFGIFFPQPAKKVYNALEISAYGDHFLSKTFIPEFSFRIARKPIST